MLYDKLKSYAADGIYPMHMPGHKRNSGFIPAGLPFDIDVTEIPGFDDLHNPEGVLRETTDLAAKLYDSQKAFLLINGTTVGILAAIGAHTEHGDKILTTVNCHWSTPNAADLFGLEIVYITPDVDEISGVPCSITPDAIKSALNKNPDIKLIVITSPTYEGVVSDIASIAGIVHNAGLPLLVDSAHGAHLGFSEKFPESSVHTGADIVVMSLHKTLPALTQSSLLHVCSERANTDKIKKLLSILQTSSPSYILMASIDYCLRLLMSDSEKLFYDYYVKLSGFFNSVQDLKNLSVLCNGRDIKHSGFFDFDPGKIVIITKNTCINSSLLSEVLRVEHQIEIERVYTDYIIAMTSICDCPEGFTRLANALCIIDRNIN